MVALYNFQYYPLTPRHQRFIGKTEVQPDLDFSVTIKLPYSYTCNILNYNIMYSKKLPPLMNDTHIAAYSSELRTT